MELDITLSSLFTLGHSPHIPGYNIKRELLSVVKARFNMKVFTTRFGDCPTAMTILTA